MTNGNHAATKRRRKMVRFQMLIPADLVEQLDELTAEGDLSRSDHVRALLREGLRRRAAS